MCLVLHIIGTAARVLQRVGVERQQLRVLHQQGKPAHKKREGGESGWEASWQGITKLMHQQG